MADDKIIGVKGKWIDGVSGPYQRTTDKINGASKRMGDKVRHHVGVRGRKAMSDFAERAERGRTVLTLMAGELGVVGGEITYFIGNIAAVVGRFQLWQVAVVAVTAAIGGLVYAFSGVTEETEKWRKKLRETQDALNDLESDTETWLLQQRQAREGWTEYEKKLRDVRVEHQKYQQMYDKAFARLEEYKETQTATAQLTGEWMEDVPEHILLMYETAQRGLAATARQIRAIREEEVVGLNRAMDEAINKAGEAASSGGGGGGGGRGGPGFWDMDVPENMFGSDESWERAAQRARTHLDQYYRMVDSMTDRLASLGEGRVEREARAEEWLYDYKQRLAEKALRDAEERQQAQNAVVENSIALFGELGQLAAQNAQQSAAARIATIIMEAGYRVIQEMAAGFSALGAAQPWLAAQHFTSAGLYAALAAGNVAQTASGGGSGGMGGGGRQAVRDFGGGEEPEEKSTTIIVELGGREVGRALLDTMKRAERDRNPGATTSRLSD